ncbi:MAG: nucleotide-binding protein [Deltaproteobacteria bacterium]|nr:nucleotide-binding protein [Deltaproteobacteria bacterium]
MSTENDTPAVLVIKREEAREKLEERIKEGETIRNSKIPLYGINEKYQKFYSWSDYNSELLERIFSDKKYMNEYNTKFLIPIYSNPSYEDKLNNFQGYVDNKIQKLKSILGRLDLIPESFSRKKISSLKSYSNKVFVVHGHDGGAKANLEIFLRDIGMEPIVLHRQADQGKTIIEKFEQYSDVGYAFILLTPDEVAYLVSEEKSEDKDRKKEKRARPNVIFEYGFFVGRLGRERVCCLLKGGISLPSDVSGIIYKRFNESIEEVGVGILKELKAAGYEVNIPG